MNPEEKMLLDEQARDAPKRQTKPPQKKNVDTSAQSFIFNKLAGNSWTKYYSRHKNEITKIDNILGTPISSLVDTSEMDPENAEMCEQIMVKHMIIIVMFVCVILITTQWNRGKCTNRMDQVNEIFYIQPQPLKAMSQRQETTSLPAVGAF